MRTVSLIQSAVQSVHPPSPDRPSIHGSGRWPAIAERLPEPRDEPDGPGVLVPTTRYWPRTDPAVLAATVPVALDVDADGRPDFVFVVRLSVVDRNGNATPDRDGDEVRMVVESARAVGRLPLAVCGVVRRRVVARVIESV